MWNWIRKHCGPQEQPQFHQGATEEIRGESRRDYSDQVRLIWRNPQGAEETLYATIENTSACGIGLVVGSEMPTGQVVLVAKDNSAVCQAVVRYCRLETPTLFRLGARVIDAEKRRLARREAVGQCEISWISDGGNRQVLSGSIENLSDLGSQFTLLASIPAGTGVRLKFNEKVQIGRVSYCVNRRDSFLLGVQFHESPHLDQKPIDASVPERLSVASWQRQGLPSKTRQIAQESLTRPSI